MDTGTVSLSLRKRLRQILFLKVWIGFCLTFSNRFSFGLPFVHFVCEPSEHKEMLIFFRMLGEIARSQTNCLRSLQNDLAHHRGMVVKMEKVFTFDSSKGCRKRYLLACVLWKLLLGTLNCQTYYSGNTIFWASSFPFLYIEWYDLDISYTSKTDICLLLYIFI